MKKKTASLGLAAALTFFSLASTTLAEELWVAPAPFTSPAADVFPWSTTAGGYAFFGFSIPNDMDTFVSAAVVVNPASSFSGNYDVYANVKQHGEPAGGGLGFTLSTPATLTAGTLHELDVSTVLAGALDMDSPGNDYASVFFWFPLAPGVQDAKVIGLRFVYERKLVESADLVDAAVTGANLASNSVDSSKVVNGSLTSDDIQNDTLTGADIAPNAIGASELAPNAVTSTSIVDGSVLNADIANNSINGAKIADFSVANGDLANSSVNSVKIVDNTVTSADILNGTIGVSDINPNQVQQRITGSCPVGQSVRAVAANGGVTCEVDTAGMLLHEIRSVNSSCASNFACWQTVVCVGGRRVMGGGLVLDETFGAPFWDKVDLVESGPVNNATWRVALVNSNGSTADFIAYAVCSAPATGASSASLTDEAADEFGQAPLGAR